MNGDKLMFWVNILLFFSLIGQDNHLKYLTLIIWITATILMLRSTPSKFMKFYYSILIAVLLLFLAYLIYKNYINY